MFLSESDLVQQYNCHNHHILCLGDQSGRRCLSVAYLCYLLASVMLQGSEKGSLCLWVDMLLLLTEGISYHCFNLCCRLCTACVLKGGCVLTYF